MAQTIQEALGHQDGKKATADAVEYMDTVEAYNKWAEVYDTDGNFLQALDTIEMRSLLPRFLDLVQTKANENEKDKQLTLVDLGCGTGRNTLQLAKAAHNNARVIGLDASPGMLEVAGETLRGAGTGVRNRVTLSVYDLLSADDLSLSGSLDSVGAAGIISTLVLEHIPVNTFFEGARRLIKPGGYFLVTNMHAEMGKISQAGFVDEKTGTKIRPTSYAHRIGDVLAAAERAGFEVVALDGGEKVRERKVDETMVESLGARTRKWVGVTVWFGICFRLRSA